jgi:hypothetical protein
MYVFAKDRDFILIVLISLRPLSYSIRSWNSPAIRSISFLKSKASQAFIKKMSRFLLVIRSFLQLIIPIIFFVKCAKKLAL